MPDITNEHLMQLIYRVIKKVDSIEEKLNQVIDYVETQKKNQSANSQLEEQEEFKYYPIGNMEELDYISSKIENDEIYKKKLRNFIKAIPYFTLEDIFTEEFLCDIKTLDDFIPYEEIYVYLKRLEGMSEDFIKTHVLSELSRIKGRVRHRSTLKKKRKIERCYRSESPNETSQTQQSDSDFVEYVEIQDEPESEQTEESKLDIVKTFVPVTYAEDTKESLNSTEPETDFLDDDEDYFTPINDQRDLMKVCEKIRLKPSYLKSVRKQLFHATAGGNIKLDDLFTLNFIADYNMTGVQGKKSLRKLLPYSTIYLFVKKKLGIPVHDIEVQATNELKQMKHRQFQRKYDSKKRLKHLYNKEKQEPEDKDKVDESN